ncbi:MAG: hypothetical protein AAF512_22225 [Pseudomonadota bacterium]
MNQFIRIYILPGAMLQSVIIAGGYGTGREVVEYFAGYGMTNGIYGMLVAAICMAIVFVLTLEISRIYQVYDYRRFFQVLLGRAWLVYEILAVMLFMLVIAVIGSAAGTVLNNELGLPEILGAAIMLIAVTIILFYGRELVTRLLTYWSLFLYFVFLAYLTLVFINLGEGIEHGFATSENTDGWAARGLQYTGYNMTAIPIILYCAMAIKTRRQAIIAGITGAVIAMLPGLMLHVSFAAFYPDILEEPLPIYTVFTALNIEILKFAYLLVLFGTFIETGAGNLQGFVERLDGWWKEKRGVSLSRQTHAAIAAVAMLLAGGLSHFGIVALIAEGYGTLAWGFIIVYAIPLLTIGIYKIIRADNVPNST